MKPFVLNVLGWGIVSIFGLGIGETEEGSIPSWDWGHGPLRVSSNGRYLEHIDGTYFLYLADTAWELFHRLNRKETERYLENRRAKGFTVIQAVLLAELDGIGTPNVYGDLPFLNRDPKQPNERYFAHVDWVLDQAMVKGLGVGLLPTWGGYVTSWGNHSSLFDEHSAEEYGRWLGSRYGKRPNIIWILGGDRPAAGYGCPDRRKIWDAMARGLVLGAVGQEDYSRILITYHPMGRHSSSIWFHDRPWLSFNMVQSGHYARDDAHHWFLVAEDYQWKPIKPVINGEACYEDIGVGMRNGQHGYFDDFDVRQSAYWSLFAGACGYTYGAHGIWQMYAPNRGPVLHARRYWYDSLDLPGAFQMKHLRKFILARDPKSREPAQNLLVDDYGETPRHLRACRGQGYVYVYTPYGSPIRIHQTRLGEGEWHLIWFNPRTGEEHPMGKTVQDSEQILLIPPGKEQRGNDWVLILEQF